MQAVPSSTHSLNWEITTCKRKETRSSRELIGGQRNGRVKLERSSAVNDTPNFKPCHLTPTAAGSGTSKRSKPVNLLYVALMNLTILSLMVWALLIVEATPVATFSYVTSGLEKTFILSGSQSSSIFAMMVRNLGGAPRKTIQIHGDVTGIISTIQE